MSADHHQGESGTLFDKLVSLARKGDWHRLDDVVKLAVKAWSENRLVDSELEYIEQIIHARRRGEPAVSGPPKIRRPETHVGSRPRTDGSFARRRFHMAIGLLPDSFLGGARWGIFAVLNFIARIIMEGGRCTLHVDEIAARTGYGKSTVQAALAYARMRGWLLVEYRRPPGQRRNLTNLITLASDEWKTWLRARAATWRGLTKRGRAFWGMVGSNLPSTTRTRDSNSAAQEAATWIKGRLRRPKRAPGGSTASPGPSRPPSLEPC